MKQDIITNIVQLQVFTQEGDQRVKIPITLLPNLIEGINDKGYEIIHMSGGKSHKVMGFLFGGEEFYKESRIICIGDAKKTID